MTSNFTLNQIGLMHGTDKSSVHHNYLNFYEPFVSSLRHAEVSILEIGVLGGASLRTWADYFPSAKVIGADINPLSKRHQAGRIKIEILDQSNIEDLVRIAVKYGPFDLIIEDGSHVWEHQITSFKTLFPFLKNNGIYIAEDIQTSFGTTDNKYKGRSRVSCIEYLREFMEVCVGGDRVNLDEVEDPFIRTYAQKIRSINFTRHACLIEKNYPVEAHRFRPLSNAENSEILDNQFTLVPAQIVAHVSQIGDVVGEQGYVYLPDGEPEIQSFSIICQGDVIEYRALVEGESLWSDFKSSGELVGTRGKSRPLVGFSVRLKNQHKNNFELKIFGKFADNSKIVCVTQDQDCVYENKSLCGIQIDIYEKRSS